MPRITYLASDGSPTEVDAEGSATVMEAAVRNGVPGIEGECGGACTCATCHVYVDESWIARLGEAGAIEREMLEFVDDRRENSRLSCQIEVAGDLDGLVVHTPRQQG